MNKYERYKKVDLPWLEEVPEHWEVSPISHVFEERKEKNQKGDIKFILSVIKNRGVIPYTEKGSVGNKASENIENYKIVYPNDMVLNSMNMMIGSLGKSKYKGVLSQVYYVLRLINESEHNIDYLNYLFQVKPFYESFRVLGKGILDHRLRVPMQMLKYEKVILPPLIEQKQIATYLNWKINEIDRLIAVEKEKIEKLNRLFEKIISFNSSNMKEESIRKYVDIVRGNSTFTKDDLLSKGTYVALQYGKVYKVDTIDNNYNFYVNDEFYKSSQIVDRNDIIAVYTSETIEDLGHFAFYDRDEKGLIGGEQLLIKPKEGIDPKYLFYCLKKDALLLKKASTGIKVYRFKSNDLKSIKIPVVSLNEQKKIVERIEKKLSKVKRNIDICNSIIGELNSFKYSLISEVVIGKIDVRSVVIPSYEKVDVDISTDEEEIEE
ncbi:MULTISPECIES: restriction endonuclease subunit S [Streptococcus]|jgi:probable type I restriction-modification system|uniref:EcoKI restriction-modification system protein HsdS n=1 Tax=Streptococcus mitis TaxID=28037 RepID=A0A428H1Y1_STRMT|nr:restriction endonuclease subunit S [Streptococcus mitis]RSJ89792.1 EcoKI restriction-modification system protein HsdS [Streptococcus mitis]